ncbi:hypothetical protein Patl1_35723 [Pistacia atlantica]|nr:hypothetical protein Patl1_35723 [Pistacia atlantica]
MPRSTTIYSEVAFHFVVVPLIVEIRVSSHAGIRSIKTANDMVQVVKDCILNTSSSTLLQCHQHSVHCFLMCLLCLEEVSDTDSKFTCYIA